MTTVVHCLYEPFDVLVGRPSRWSNPFRLKKNRSLLIARFALNLLDDKDLLRALPELRDQRLGCYCTPQRCHGHVLAALADERLEHDQLRTWANWVRARMPKTYEGWPDSTLWAFDRAIFEAEE